MRVVILLVLLFVSVISFAQKDEKKKTIEEKSIDMADELKKDLGLSDEQYEKVRLGNIEKLVLSQKSQNAMDELDGSFEDDDKDEKFKF